MRVRDVWAYVFLYEPSWRKNYEVCDRCADVVALCCEYGEDAWIWVVVGDAADGIEAAEVVLVWIVPSMPGNDVERSMVLFCCEEMTVEFAYERPLALGVFFERSDRSLEISRVGQAIRSDWTQFRKLEVALVKLEDVASNRSFWHRDPVADTSRNDTDLVGSD